MERQEWLMGRISELDSKIVQEQEDDGWMFLGVRLSKLEYDSVKDVLRENWNKELIEVKQELKELL